jgi:hypothetical protein
MPDPEITADEFRPGRREFRPVTRHSSTIDPIFEIGVCSPGRGEQAVRPGPLDSTGYPPIGDT